MIDYSVMTLPIFIFSPVCSLATFCCRYVVSF